MPHMTGFEDLKSSLSTFIDKPKISLVRIQRRLTTLYAFFLLGTAFFLFYFFDLDFWVMLEQPWGLSFDIPRKQVLSKRVCDLLIDFEIYSYGCWQNWIYVGAASLVVVRTARQVICGCLLSSMVLTFESIARKSFLESTTLQDKQMKRQKTWAIVVLYV